MRRTCYNAGVSGSRVKARKSPITGAISFAGAGREIIELCRRDLAPHKVPAAIRFVPTLPMSAKGKLLRLA
jgi:acyl-coenzyme A synthetase/AMP-(fatty) acid ligase